MINPAVTQLVTEMGAILICPCPAKQVKYDNEGDTVHEKLLYCVSIERRGYQPVRVPLDEIEDFQSAIATAAETLRKWQAEGLPEQMETMLDIDNLDDD